MKRCSVIFGTAVMALLWPLAAFAQGLTPGNASSIFSSCATTAAGTPSAVRGAGKFTKMWCAVIDREGKLLLIESTDTSGTPSSPAGSDAWRGGIEVAIAKAYTAVAFSSNDQVLDSRTIGLLARIDVRPEDHGAPGTDSGPAPLFGVGDTNPFRGTSLGAALGGDDVTLKFHHGIVTFAGGQPVYQCSSPHHLLGAVGVSGDGVDEDDTVAKGAVTGAGFCLTP